jgi:hypothetical protein
MQAPYSAKERFSHFRFSTRDFLAKLRILTNVCSHADLAQPDSIHDYTLLVPRVYILSGTNLDSPRISTPTTLALVLTVTG